jgi:hypothetical protein
MKFKYIGRFVMTIVTGLIPVMIEYFIMSKMQAKEKADLARSLAPKSASEA